jgi:hypothetical protein
MRKICKGSGFFFSKVNAWQKGVGMLKFAKGSVRSRRKVFAWIEARRVPGEKKQTFSVRVRLLLMS